MFNSTLIHYEELALKGKNRPYFEQRLIANIQKALKERVEVRREYGRLYIDKALPEDKIALIAKLFGVSWAAPAVKCSPEIGTIGKHCINLVSQLMNEEYASARPRTFAIRASRADKNFPFTSQEIEAKLGQSIIDKFSLTVNLKEPELTVSVEIASQSAFLHISSFTKEETRKGSSDGSRKGPGGLPAGTSGHVVVLFSGGLDSAAAAYLLGQRGCTVHLLHVHALPHNQEVANSKVFQLAQALAPHYPGLKLMLMPYTDFSLAAMSLPNNLAGQEVIVFRRFLACCAQRLAKNTRADAIASGDSLGQVASQTMSNLRAVDMALDRSMLLLRPLVGFSKNRISKIGEEIGLTDIARQEYKDCCSLVAKHPETKANLRKIEEIEKRIRVDKLLEKAFVASETIDVS